MATEKFNCDACSPNMECEVKLKGNIMLEDMPERCPLNGAPAHFEFDIEKEREKVYVVYYSYEYNCESTITLHKTYHGAVKRIIELMDECRGYMDEEAIETMKKHLASSSKFDGSLWFNLTDGDEEIIIMYLDVED